MAKHLAVALLVLVAAGVGAYAITSGNAHAQVGAVIIAGVNAYLVHKTITSHNDA